VPVPVCVPVPDVLFIFRARIWARNKGLKLPLNHTEQKKSSHLLNISEIEIVQQKTKKEDDGARERKKSLKQRKVSLS
jgi:hypothetical protein